VKVSLVFKDRKNGGSTRVGSPHQLQKRRWHFLVVINPYVKRSKVL